MKIILDHDEICKAIREHLLKDGLLVVEDENREAFKFTGEEEVLSVTLSNVVIIPKPEPEPPVKRRPSVEEDDEADEKEEAKSPTEEIDPRIVEHPRPPTFLTPPKQVELRDYVSSNNARILSQFESMGAALDADE